MSRKKADKATILDVKLSVMAAQLEGQRRRAEAAEANMVALLMLNDSYRSVVQPPVAPALAAAPSRSSSSSESVADVDSSTDAEMGSDSDSDS